MKLPFVPTEDDLAKANELVERVKPLLAGIPPQIQGAALAQLLATWIAGHVVEGHPEASEQLRAILLKFHIAFVEQLIPAIAEEFHSG